MFGLRSIADAGSNSLPKEKLLIHGTHAQLVLFLVFNMWTCLFALPVLLAIVVFSKRVHRHPTFTSFVVAFIITGYASSLLAFAGKTTGPQPSPLLCLLQASLLYGTPVLNASCALALVLQMFFVIRSSYLGQDYKEEDHLVRRWVMVTLPYLGFLMAVVATSAVGSHDPRRVSRDRRFFYCSVDSNPLSDTITIYAGIVLLITVVLMTSAAAIITKHWLAFRRNPYHSGWELELSFPIRIIIFGVYLCIAMAISFGSLGSPSSPVPDLVISAASTLFICIFGSQSDILSVLSIRMNRRLVRPRLKRGSSVSFA